MISLTVEIHGGDSWRMFSFGKYSFVGGNRNRMTFQMAMKIMEDTFCFPLLILENKEVLFHCQ